MILPIAEWLYRWLNENPEASIEDGLKAYQLARESNSQEISDEEIEKESNKYIIDVYKYYFQEGAKWYREQLKKKQ